MLISFIKYSPNVENTRVRSVGRFFALFQSWGVYMFTKSWAANRDP